MSTIWLGQASAQSKFYGSSGGSVIDVVDEVQNRNPVIRSIFEEKVKLYTNSGTWKNDKNISWFDGTDENGKPVTYRIANGAWILVEAISPYIQWIIFFGMSLSVILIIYNGATIVMSAGDDSKLKSAKDNIQHILIGVLVLWGFYFILRVVGGLLLNLIWW